MFLLKKIFQLRDQANEDDEKPFLEHLEDLRVVITRLVITLLAAMTVCFIFRNELMEIIRRPVEEVWKISQDDKIPKGPVKLDLETWETAKKAAHDTASFSPVQRAYYYKLIDPTGDKKLQFHSESVIYYQAAIDMENTSKRGVEFIMGLPEISEELKEQLLALMLKEHRPDATVNARGKLVLMQALNPTEGFMLSIKLALFAGIVISFPVLLFFTLQFVLPGLKNNEKKVLWPALIIGFGLFLTGVLFSYFLVLPKVLDFFYNYSQKMGVTNEWRIGYYISFATQFTLIFGLSFELPVVVMTMVRLGVLNYEIMRNTRAYAILAIVIIAAVITPTPDAFTLLLLAGPMVVLYEICIWLAFFYKRKEREAELAEAEELKKKLLAAPPMTASYDHESEDDHDPYFKQDYHADHFHEHDEDEGDEEDSGTYDFDDDELIEDSPTSQHRKSPSDDDNLRKQSKHDGRDAEGRNQDSP